jgi:WD40 repeat protein
MNVFISYARADGGPLARRLRDDFIAAEHEAWYDQSAIPGGADWSRAVEDAIDRCDCLVAVLTAGAFESAICRGEHLRALRRNKRLIPLLAQAVTDRPVYLETANFFEFTEPDRYGESLARLLEALDTGKGERLDNLDARYRTPNVFNVRPLPAGYVERAEELDALRQAVLEGGDGGLVAVHGLPGGGKSTLALSLCHLPIVQDAFPDGVIWVDVGRDRTERTLVDALALVGTSLGDSTDHYHTVADAAGRLRSVLQGKAVLLVLDDVWKRAHVEAFRAAAPKVRVLYTTRDETVPLFLGGYAERLGPMSTPVAVGMLEAITKRQDAGFTEVAERLGGLPIALKLVGARLGEGLGTDEWRDEFAAFSDLKLGRRAQGREDNVRICFDWSLELLSPEDRRCFDALGVLPEDTPTPTSVVSRLWQALDPPLPARDCVPLLTELKRLALVDLSDSDEVSLHDLMVEYARENLGDEATSVHRALLNSYRGDDRPWREVEADGYIHVQLAHHLDGAGARDELRSLLLDAGWLEVKLDTCGLPSLLGDYERLEDEEELRLVRRALRLSARALVASSAELPTQLVGRLGHRVEAGIASLLAGAGEDRDALWLRPVLTTLALPDDILRARLDGNLAVALNEDGSRAIVDDGHRIQVWDVRYGVVTTALDGHTDEVLALAVSGDGRRVLSGARDGTVRLWDGFRGGAPRFTSADLGGEVTAVSITSDGATGVSLTNGVVTVWDLRAPGARWTFRPESGARCIDVDDTGRLVLTGGEDGALRLWAVADEKETATMAAFEVPVTAARITGIDSTCVAGSLEGSMVVWSPATDAARPLGLPGGGPAHRAEVTSIALTADGRFALSGSLTPFIDWDFDAPAPVPDTVDQLVRYWDVSQGVMVRGLPQTSSAHSTAIDHDGRVGASSGHGTSLWDLWEAEERPASDQVSCVVRCIAVSPNSRLAAVATTDSRIRLWCVSDGAPQGDVLELPEHEDAEVLTFTEDGERLVAVSSWGLIRAWNADTGSLAYEHRAFAEIEEIASYDCFLHGREHAILCNRAGTMAYWDLNDGVELIRLEGAGGCPRRVAFARDGSRAVGLCPEDRAVHVWELRASGSTFSVDLGDAFPSREQLEKNREQPVDADFWEYLSHNDWWGLALSADGKRAVCTVEHGPLVVCDLERRTCTVIEADLEKNPDVFVLADGARALTRSFSGAVRLWDLNAGEEVWRLQVTEEPTDFEVTLANEDRWLVSGSSEGTVRLWDLDSREPLASFTADEYISGLAVTPDAGSIVAGDGHGNLHILRVEGVLSLT